MGFAPNQQLVCRVKQELPRLSQTSTPVVTPSFIDPIVKEPTINHEMRRVAIVTYFLEAMDAPPPNEDG